MILFISSPFFCTSPKSLLHKTASNKDASRATSAIHQSRAPPPPHYSTTHNGDLVDGLFQLQDVVLQVQHLLGSPTGRGELLLQHLLRLHQDPT